jgi:hypothetical protein
MFKRIQKSLNKKLKYVSFFMMFQNKVSRKSLIINILL